MTNVCVQVDDVFLLIAAKSFELLLMLLQFNLTLIALWVKISNKMNKFQRICKHTRVQICV